MAVYNRYKSFTGDDGTVQTVPFIPIPVKQTDKYTYWEAGTTRADILSYSYYGDPSFGWLILQANPELPSIEHLIPDGSRVRIPYPVESTISQYESDIKVYKQINGIS